MNERTQFKALIQFLIYSKIKILVRSQSNANWITDKNKEDQVQSESLPSFYGRHGLKWT